MGENVNVLVLVHVQESIPWKPRNHQVILGSNGENAVQSTVLQYP